MFYTIPPRKILVGAVLILTSLGPIRAETSLSQILGFENNGDWSVIQGQEAVQAQHSTDPGFVRQGEASLRVDVSGYGMVASIPSSTALLQSNGTISLQLRMPNTLGNPWWAGAVDLFVNAPSANVYRQPLGHHDLTGKPLGEWAVLSFLIPANLQTLFTSPHPDVSFEIALNSAPGTETFYLDGMGGLDTRYSVRLDEGDHGEATVLFWDQPTSQAELQFCVNGSVVSTLAMQEMEGFDRFDATVEGLAPGDTLRWQVRFLADGQWYETGWRNTTMYGPHRIMDLGDGARVIQRYNPAVPTELKPEWSTRYAMAISTRALTTAELATMESLGARRLGLSHSAKHGYYTISYTGDINALARSLQEHIQPFLNLAPFPRAKQVSRAENPGNAPGAPLRIFATCYPDVPLHECRATMQPFAEDGVVRGSDVNRGMALEITEFALDLLRQQDNIMVLEEYSTPQPTSSATRSVMKVDLLQSRLGSSAFSKTNPIHLDWLKGMPYTGEDIEIAIYDSGVNSSIPDFQEAGQLRSFDPGDAWRNAYSEIIWSIDRDPPTYHWLETNQNPENSVRNRNHGNAVAGIALGNGAQSPDLLEYTHRGVAPKAKFWSLAYQSHSFHTIPGHISNHSHKDMVDHIFYTKYSGKEVDNVLHAQDFVDGKRKVVVIAAGNFGVQGRDDYGNLEFTNGQPSKEGEIYIGWYSIEWNTKNPISVGATSHSGWKADYSSMGPTPDGRIKPDVMAVGGQFPDDKLTWPLGLDEYPEHYAADFGATSIAAPQITGIVALMQQKLRNEILHCTPSIPCPAFDAQSMRNSTAKAILIQTARDMSQDKGTMAYYEHWNPDQTATEGRTSYEFFGKGPDFATGWGWADAEKAVDFVDPAHFSETSLEANDIKEYYFDVPTDPAGDLNFTIAWDDPGTGCILTNSRKFSNDCHLLPFLINDIDLYLEAPDGTKFYPWKLKPFLGPQSWDKKNYVPSRGIDSINEARVEFNVAYRDCRIKRDIANNDFSEACFDHLNNVEKVTVDKADITMERTGRWKAVIKAHMMGSANQVVSVVSDYDISGAADNAIRKVYLNVKDQAGATCPTGYSSVTDDLNQGSGGKYIYLCATKDQTVGAPLRALKILSIDDNPFLSSLFPPQGYSHVASDQNPSGNQATDLNENSGGRYIYLYQSTEESEGSPIDEIKSLATTDANLAALPGYVILPQDLNDGAGGHYIYLFYQNSNLGPITDLFVQFGENSSCPTGYDRVSGDLNRGSGGAYIYLCASRDPSKGLPIVELTTEVRSDDAYPAIPAGFEAPFNSKAFQIQGIWAFRYADLNEGSGGKYIYLYQRRSATEAPIQDLTFVSWTENDPPVPEGWTKLGQDLNEGASGDYVYLIYSK